MRMPSLNYVLTEAARLVLRFPFVLAAAFFASVCAVGLVNEPESSLMARCLMSAQLGIPLLLALALYAERRGGWKLPLSLVGTAALVAYFFSLPQVPRNADWARFIQFNLAAHLLAAFLPYLGRREARGFWQFNKALFLRMVGSLLFTGVLVVGLNVALLALDKLFGLTIDDELYQHIDLLLLFLFNTWYFLGGVPSDWPALERSRDYPRGLKVFAQYILSPLVAVYLALLTAYLVKVILTTQWPSGWIGWLVSSVAAAGLFSLVLLHPLVEQKENRWIATYSRAYFILMLPAVGMQLMAIAKRIGQYGMTENRYFIVLLALWLLGVSLVGALGRLKRLKPLPLTLCLLALLSSFGPWSAYSVSRGSQVGRLEVLLASENLLQDGRLAAAAVPVTPETRRELSAILDYLMENHGPEVVEHWLSEAQSGEMAALADSLDEPRQHRELSTQLMDYLELNYVTHWQRSPDRTWHHYVREEGAGIELGSFDQLWPLHLSQDKGAAIALADRELGLKLEASTLSLESGQEPLLTMSLDALLAALSDHGRESGGESAPDSLLILNAEAGSFRARLHLTKINWRDEGEGAQVNQLGGFLLLTQSP